MGVWLYLDDIQTYDDLDLWQFQEEYGDQEWLIVKTAEECIEALKQNNVDVLSLDHDLGYEGNGMDVVKWMEQATNDGWIPPKYIYVHSANWVATKAMQLAIKCMKERANK